MGGVAVPKTVQKPTLPREDAPEVPVDRGPMSKTVQKPLFVTPGCPWSTCGHGGRAEEQSEVPLWHAITCIRWAQPSSRVHGSTASLSLPLSAAIDLHEIHLAPQSSLQVPVGHIPVPGGIKLCSPGTFLVANYLIINNGSCQVNFMKPNRATIRYTNSQWLPEDVTEAPVGKGAVPKSGRSIDQRPV